MSRALAAVASAYLFGVVAIQHMPATGRIALAASQYQTGDTLKDCANCPEMVIVPPGVFTMGSPETEKDRDNDEGPQRRVRIPRPLAVGKFEVTVEQFAAFVRETGHDVGDECFTFENGLTFKKQSSRSWRNPGFSQGPLHPVVCVNWEDAKAYAAWLSRVTGEDYRLPSESEWEFAARAGTTTRYSFGDQVSQICKYANTADQSTSYPWRNKTCSDRVGEKTAEVGSYMPNAFGLHDTHGNVLEWVEDCYKKSYLGAPTDGSALTNQTCSKRVLRSSSWPDGPKPSRSAVRAANWTNSRYSVVGFRVARTL